MLFQHRLTFIPCVYNGSLHCHVSATFYTSVFLVQESTCQGDSVFSFQVLNGRRALIPLLPTDCIRKVSRIYEGRRRWITSDPRRDERLALANLEGPELIVGVEVHARDVQTLSRDDVAEYPI